MSEDAICRAIAGQRYRYTSEAELQQGVAQALAAAGIEAEPEVPLGEAGRIDFLAGRVGIEVKAARRWSRPGVVSQLQRYLLRPELDVIVLVTDRSQLWMPATLAGKPVAVVKIRGGLL